MSLTASPTAPPDATETDADGFTPKPKIIDELIALQGTMSDDDFCREYGFGYVSSTWNKMRNWIDRRERITVRGQEVTNPAYGSITYKGDVTAVLAECERMRRRIMDRRALGNRERRGVVFLNFPHFANILERAKLLLDDEGTQNRVLFYLAETGGGKTQLCREVTAANGGVLIEAKESWRHSYFNAACDVANALQKAANITPTDFRSAAKAEAEILTRLRARKMVVAIDEGEYFGPHSLNLIKLVANQTPAVVLIAAIPELWKRVQKEAWVESLQIVRRTELRSSMGLIHAADVQQFMDSYEVYLNGTSAESCAAIARAANQFGKYDLIVRVALRLSVEKPETVKDVEQTCRSVQAQIGYTPSAK